MKYLSQSFIKGLKILDLKTVLILVWVPIALSVIEYFFGVRSTFSFDDLAGVLPETFVGIQNHLWYFLGCSVFMLGLPLLFFGKVGFQLKATLGGAKIYFCLYLLALPFIYVASLTEGFQEIYPFFRPPMGLYSLGFLLFEIAYCLQFLAVEYFFRGMMVLGLKKKFGMYSVFIMLAPYCMLHFHKPFTEALGAIVAGIVLGVLAWETETILYGWGLHYAVALTMDLLALNK